jgi:hypothetical protein
LLGGIIGAAVAVGLNVVLEGGFLGGQRIEAQWFPVVIGALTGLGVRLANRHHMDRSYARGAVSALIALAAIVASSFAVKEVMARRETQAKAAPIGAAAQAEAEESADEAADADAGEAEAAEPTPDREAARGPVRVGGQPKGPNDINPWQFVFMALGALVAYELGRGPDPAKRAPAEAPPEEPLSGGTDPSN